MKWLSRNWPQLLSALAEHIAIAAAALSIALALALGSGVYAARRPRVLALAVGASGMLYTVPTLASARTRGRRAA